MKLKEIYDSPERATNETQPGQEGRESSRPVVLHETAIIVMLNETTNT